jgi:hypothetical protein
MWAVVTAAVGAVGGGMVFMNIGESVQGSVPRLRNSNHPITFSPMCHWCVRLQLAMP